MLEFDILNQAGVVINEVNEVNEVPLQSEYHLNLKVKDLICYTENFVECNKCNEKECDNCIGYAIVTDYENMTIKCEKLVYFYNFKDCNFLKKKIKQLL